MVIDTVVALRERKKKIELGGVLKQSVVNCSKLAVIYYSFIHLINRFFFYVSVYMRV